MFNPELRQLESASKHGLNFQSHGQLVEMQQWRLVRGFFSMQGYVVEMSGERRDFKIKPADLGAAPGGFIRILNNRTNRQPLKPGAPEKN
jgi:hypothetical protein